MKTLVVVLTHAAARPILDMNLPWLRKSGCDICVVNHVEDSNFPDVDLKLMMGGPPESSENKWVDRFMDVTHWLTTSTACDVYDRYVLTEADSIFVAPPPKFDGFWATMAGYKSPGFKGEMFYHAPWCMTQEAAREFLRRGRIMLNYRINEQGYIDRFIGAYRDMYGVYIGNLAGQTFSRNTITPEHVADCREAIKRGAWFIHGIKTPEILQAITEGL